MSNWMNLPTGRRLEQADYDPHHVGTVGVLRPADEGRLRLARRSLRELAERDVVGRGKYLLDKTTGETLEVITTFCDLVDPTLTGAVAFTIRDSLLVPLRPKGWEPAVESHYAGTIEGREASPRDPMPVGPRVF